MRSVRLTPNVLARDTDWETASMPRIVLVKHESGTLLSGCAMEYDTDNGFVLLAEALNVGGDIPIRRVPKDYCYTFDGDLQHAVNSMVLQAKLHHQLAADSLKSAHQLLLCAGQQVNFDPDDEDDRPRVRH